MALSQGRAFGYHHKSAFAMNFLRPSLYINGDSSIGTPDTSRRTSAESDSIVWREVYQRIVAADPNFLFDDAAKRATDDSTASARSPTNQPGHYRNDGSAMYKYDPNLLLGGLRQGSLVSFVGSENPSGASNGDCGGGGAGGSGSQRTGQPSISITRQLAFGKCSTEEVCESKRKWRIACTKTSITMFASVSLVLVCFVGVLVLRAKEMEVEKRLLDSWRVKEEHDRKNTSIIDTSSGANIRVEQTEKQRRIIRTVKRRENKLAEVILL